MANELLLVGALGVGGLVLLSMFGKNKKGGHGKWGGMKGKRGMRGGRGGRGGKWRNMTPEQRAQFKAMRQQKRMQAGPSAYYGSLISA